MSVNMKKTVVEGFSLGDIGRAFDSIGNIFNQIGDIFNQIGQIQKMIECPINLMRNLPTCVYYYSIDTSVIVLYNIVYWILYIFLFVPIFIAFFIVKMTFSTMKSAGLEFVYGNSLWGNYDILNSLEIKPEHICPPEMKTNIAYSIEYLNRVISGNNNLVNRTSSDIDNCYCNRIENVFTPLKNYEDPNANTPDAKMQSIYLFISFVVLLLLCLIRYMKWGIRKKGEEKE